MFLLGLTRYLILKYELPASLQASWDAAAQVPTKVAVAIKQVPTKLAYGIKALADGDDNKDLIVGDVFPKA